MWIFALAMHGAKEAVCQPLLFVLSSSYIMPIRDLGLKANLISLSCLPKWILLWPKKFGGSINLSKDHDLLLNIKYLLRSVCRHYCELSVVTKTFVPCNSVTASDKGICPLWTKEHLFFLFRKLTLSDNIFAYIKVFMHMLFKGKKCFYTNLLCE